MMRIIGRKFKKRPLVVPKSAKVRPTTSQLREALFNICQWEIEGARFLDLFAGSGAMGLEALSRGAAQATFVENNRLALLAIQQNIASLNVAETAQVLSYDVFTALVKLSEKKQVFDLIYADPPYGEGLGARLLGFLDKNLLLTAAGSLFIEDVDLEIPHLKTLQLYNERKLGKAHLYEFRTLPRNI
jgi:16S rRNA (guanine966-N2)-methyltransferase